MQLENGERLFEWPLAQHIITAGWTYNDGSLHRAIDLRAAVGTPVFAAEAGRVGYVQTWDGHTKAGMQSYGNMVQLRHAEYRGTTLMTRYAHLSRICVAVGDNVEEGQVIGYSGDTGNVRGAHLHFEVSCGGSRVNPLNWLDADFSCASAEVAQHLGSYTSVIMSVNRLQLMCITDPSDEIVERAAQLGLPVHHVRAAVIGPASNGDAMEIWTRANNDGSLYFASYTEEDKL